MPSPLPSLLPSAEVRRARPLLGTLVEIRAAGAEPARLHAAIDAAFAAVQRVHGLMSFHDPASEVSALNREALRRPLRVDAQTWAVLAAASRLSRLSAGAFDIAVGARLREWAYLPSAPDCSSAPLSFDGNWADIELLDDCRVRFHRPLLIDLGGIAKGYAVDCAIEVLRQAGVGAALVNAGGDLRTVGAPQLVQLRHPLDPVVAAHALSLCDEALATSANYFARRETAAGAVSPLLDPRSRQPWLGAASVSVRAADCISADALTKVVLFAAPDLAERVLAAYGAVAYLQQPAEAAA